MFGHCTKVTARRTEHVMCDMPYDGKVVYFVSACLQRPAFAATWVLPSDRSFTMVASIPIKSQADTRIGTMKWTLMINLQCAVRDCPTFAPSRKSSSAHALLAIAGLTKTS